MHRLLDIVTAIGATAVAALLHSTQVQAQALPASQMQNPWFEQGQQQVTERLDSYADEAGPGDARNVILFVGDGMGISTLAAARILGGQRNGQSGEESSLSFERFAHTALVKTYNVNAQIPDSAGTMTAMMSGIKTNAGVLGVNANVLFGNCQQVAENELVSALELAEVRGLATGVVSTARITHATPAATYAKSPNRGWEDISDMPQSAIDQGCEDIALQLVNFKSNLQQRFPDADVDGIDVVLGGGRQQFLPDNPATDLFPVYGEARGNRNDGRNLIAEWQQRYPDGRYVFDNAGLDALDSDQPGANVLGLFSASHMQYEADRVASASAQPSLTSMVAKAIAILEGQPNGYLLVVESGRIDHAHHAGNAFSALNETLELSAAVARALELTDAADTLIMVTADHSHVMTFSGYPARGNPILGKVVSRGGTGPALAQDDLPYTTLAYANGPGFRDYRENTNPDRTYADAIMAGRQNLLSVDTEAPGFHQEALVPLAAETHGGEDVTVHANGAGAFRVRGIIEQNAIFNIMDRALGLTR